MASSTVVRKGGPKIAKLTAMGGGKARRSVSRPLTATVISRYCVVSLSARSKGYCKTQGVHHVYCCSGELERMRKGGPSPEEQLAAQRQAELRHEAELVEGKREQQVRPVELRIVPLT